MHEAFVIKISYKRKSLDLLGSLIMIFMGITIIFSAGVPWFILIVLFFGLSIFATRFSKPYKEEIGQYEKTRTAKNVISNGLVAFLMAAFGSYYLPLAGGFIGAVATATADTLASEIGVLIGNPFRSFNSYQDFSYFRNIRLLYWQYPWSSSWEKTLHKQWACKFTCYHMRSNYRYRFCNVKTLILFIFQNINLFF